MAKSHNYERIALSSDSEPPLQSPDSSKRVRFGSVIIFLIIISSILVHSFTQSLSMENGFTFKESKTEKRGNSENSLCKGKCCISIAKIAFKRNLRRRREAVRGTGGRGRATRRGGAPAGAWGPLPPRGRGRAGRGVPPGGGRRLPGPA